MGVIFFMNAGKLSLAGKIEPFHESDFFLAGKIEMFLFVHS